MLFTLTQKDSTCSLTIYFSVPYLRDAVNLYSENGPLFLGFLRHTYIFAVQIFLKFVTKPPFHLSNNVERPADEATQ